MMRQTGSEPPGGWLESIVQRLDPFVGAITTRCVVTAALRRAGVRSAALATQGLPPRVVDEIIRGLSVYLRDPKELSACRHILSDMSMQPEPAKLASFEVPIKQEQDIVAARARVRELARELGFTHTDQIRVATAVSEISRNIYSYAGTGKVSAGPVDGRRVGLWIRAADDGPGIANLEEVLSGSYKSRTGMGLGLLACKQLMDSFRVVTAPGLGTRIIMEKYA